MIKDVIGRYGVTDFYMHFIVVWFKDITDLHYKVSEFHFLAIENQTAYFFHFKLFSDYCFICQALQG